MREQTKGTRFSMLKGQSMFDLLLLGGTLIDGTGASRRRCDVGVKADRVVALGDLQEREALQAVDVSGLLVTPGFVDMHAHSELTLLADGRGASKVRQGVTSEISGQCGFSAAPLLGQAREELPAFLNHLGLEPDWTTMAEFLARLEGQGIALNVGTLAGHGTLRYAVVGGSDRPATPDRREAMARLLAQTLEEGALGLSSGLFYAPGSYADHEEIAALAQVAATYGGLYASHIRNESAGLMDALQEAVAVGRATGVRVEVAHLKLGARPQWGGAGRLLAWLDSVRAEGVDLGWDQYPYTASATSLDALVPPAFHAGGTEALLARLRDPRTRSEIGRMLAGDAPGWENTMESSTWKEILLSFYPPEPELAGRTLDDVAATAGADPLEMALDLIVESGAQAGMVHFCMDEGDVAAILRHPNTAVVTDAEALAADGPLAEGAPHPRAYGTYPRVLARYVREQQVLTWEEAVRKMTSLPASRTGLRDRGVVREGAFADLVVLDPETVADAATFTEPHRYPAGIHHVVVNGQFAVRDGVQTEARSGRVLRHE
jgi:N-acyl-D-amino-acid deacylase